GFGEGATAVYFGAPAPRAGELRFDEGHDPEIAAGRRELVGRNHGVDRGCKERRLGLGQREIGCRFAPSRGNGSRRSRGLLGLRGSGWGEARGKAVLAPNRKLRRAIRLLSSGVFLSVMATSPVCRARA